ncbi:hypothetical protein [Legionella sp. W05-934-2]
MNVEQFKTAISKLIDKQSTLLPEGKKNKRFNSPRKPLVWSK